MITGAAGDDQHQADILQHRLAVGAEQAGLDAARGAQHFERVGQSHRLLEDFLLHVMAILAQFDRVCRQVRFNLGMDDERAIHPRNAIARPCQLGAIPVFQIDDAPGDLQQRRSIGCGVVATRRHPEQERRAFTRHDHPPGLRFAQDGDRIRALQLGDGSACGRKEVGRFLQFRSNQVGHNLCIGFRGEDVALVLELLTQHLMIFDDAVMHHREPLRNMRMRITLAGRTVCCPARVGDPGFARHERFFCLSRQLRDAPHRAQAMQACFVDQGQTGRVIATVLKATKAFEENGNDIAVRDRCDNATHELSRDR